MIFQEPMTSLNPCFTVGFQIREMLRAHTRLDRAGRQRRAVELLAKVGIPEPERRLKSYPHQMSGGMSQRVMIAMAISCDPKLLIADEPTTALDVTIQAQILDLLSRLQRDTGMGLVLITHDMGVVAEVADRVLVQYAGRPVETNTARGALRRPPPPLHRGAAGGPAGARDRAAAARHPGRGAGPVRPAAGLRVRAALRLRVRQCREAAPTPGRPRTRPRPVPHPARRRRADAGAGRGLRPGPAHGVPA